MKMLADEQIDAYIADRHFRKRDRRFDNAGRYKEKTTEKRRKRDGSRKQFLPRDFTFDPDLKFCICPAGKRMYRTGFRILRGAKRAALLDRKDTVALVNYELNASDIQTKPRYAKLLVHLGSQ